MNLQYSKILLFFLQLSILVTSYHEHNTNKPYITSHHTQTNRLLCECDTQSSNYNNDEDMKSVKERFDDRTSQRLRKYNERMQDKRQKYKEQRDKNIQEIIEKDKREKSLEQKIEKGCLKCGCALGGVAASVGIFGTVAVNELTKGAITAAAEEAVKDASLLADATARGVEAGKNAVIEGLKALGVSRLEHKELVSYITAQNYNKVRIIARAINSQYNASSCVIPSPDADPSNPICPWVTDKYADAMKIQATTQGNAVSMNDVIETAVETVVSNAEPVAERAVKTATEQAIEARTLAAESTYAACQTAIIASVVAIIIIALVMIIIYLVLRYRRKKKMKKKAEYTKILNQ
ncbi:rifin PIR protein,putative [Plasmodium sp. DRC-Itaito]|nr:rifin PIR protein,putative [Plasmodium sp. DRC-Itaito]